MDAVWAADLQNQDQRHHLDAKLPSIHIVTQEEVTRVGRPAVLLEDIDEIEELSMNIADHHEWVREAEHGGFVLYIKDNLQRICEDYLIIFFIISNPKLPFCFNSYVSSRILYFYVPVILFLFLLSQNLF